jgi:hypothetical protein
MKRIAKAYKTRKKSTELVQRILRYRCHITSTGGRQVGKPFGMHREKNVSITVSILVNTRCYCINTSNWEMAEGQASRNACKCQQGFDGIVA